MADFDGPDGKELTDHQDAKKNYDRLVRQKGLYNSDEIALINFLRECYRRSYPQKDANKTQFLNGGALVFNGANVRLNDNGYYYEKWTNFPNLELHLRTGLLSGSSHDSDRDQYEIYLDQAGVVLVGMCNKFAGVPFGPRTWVQSERHAGASGNPLQRIGHVLSFFDHKLHSDMQVGAFGYSPYSEKRGNALLVPNLPPISDEDTLRHGLCVARTWAPGSLAPIPFEKSDLQLPALRVVVEVVSAAAPHVAGIGTGIGISLAILGDFGWCCEVDQG